ncbi:MAG: protease modulator HflC [Aestuariivirga sp.]|uniref:protease modulator HflC n=1 Tax=Aestuariivirga sp. TaxID=2650926 RepID=UPI0025BE700C|nr:protease modulator HflC [Aestuariivirga sp.]MCA3562058.1 protease modulator HflC [Aestuariivirga sp.]
MNSTTKTILAAAAIGAALLFYLSYFVVDQKHKALVLRFGDIDRVVEEPGLYFKVPFADTVTLIDNRIMIWENNKRPVQDVASQVYIVDAFTLARIKDARRFRETLGADMQQAEQRVGARLDAALRQTYGRRSFDAALSSDRAAMMREIRDQLREEADGLGIEIVDVRVRRTDLSDNVLEQTYERMKSERNALAQDIRSQGESTKTRMNAETDRTVTEKLAQAKKEAEILRGQGDAERNKVFAEAFEQDPEFFAFYRSMQAYRKALGGDGTTMVLSPNSEFFRYFGDRQPAAPGAPAAPVPAAPAQPAQ